MSMDLKFVYHWKDIQGVHHITLSEDDAEKALKSGSTVLLQIIDRYRKDGTDRTAE